MILVCFNKLAAFFEPDDLVAEFGSRAARKDKESIV